MADELKKTCSRCKKSQPLRFFSKSMSWCKDCVTETAKKRKQYKKENRLVYLKPERAKPLAEEKELTIDQWERFWPLVREERMRLLFDLMQSIGLRANEALGLAPGDFSFNEGKVTITTLKQRGDTQKIVSFRVRPDLLSMFIQLKVDSYFPFTYRVVYRAFKTTIKKAELNRRLSPHSLRHLFAYRLRKVGASEEVRAKLLRHKSGSVTSLYGTSADTEVEDVLAKTWESQTWIWKKGDSSQ